MERGKKKKRKRKTKEEHSGRFLSRASGRQAFFERHSEEGGGGGEKRSFIVTITPTQLDAASRLATSTSEREGKTVILSLNLLLFAISTKTEGGGKEKKEGKKKLCNPALGYESVLISGKGGKRTKKGSICAEGSKPVRYL